MESEFSAGQSFSLPQYDAADLWHFLEGLSEPGAETCALEGSGSKETANDAGARPRTNASRSLPQLPLADQVPIQKHRALSADYGGVSFSEPGAADRQAGSSPDSQPHRFLAPVAEHSCSSMTDTRLATFKQQRSQSFPQHRCPTWDYGSVANAGQHLAPQAYLQDKVMPAIPQACAPIFRGIPIIVEGANIQIASLKQVSLSVTFHALAIYPCLSCVSASTILDQAPGLPCRGKLAWQSRGNHCNRRQYGRGRELQQR